MTSKESGITKKNLKGFKEEIVHQFHVSTEGIRDEVRQVAEGVAKLNEKLDCIHEDLKRKPRKQQEEGDRIFMCGFSWRHVGTPSNNSKP